MTDRPDPTRSAASAESEGSKGAELTLSNGEMVRVLESRLHVLHEIEARQAQDLGVLSLTRDDGRGIDILVRHIVYVRPMR